MSEPTFNWTGSCFPEYKTGLAKFSVGFTTFEIILDDFSIALEIHKIMRQSYFQGVRDNKHNIKIGLTSLLSDS